MDTSRNLKEEDELYDKEKQVPEYRSILDEMFALKGFEHYSDYMIIARAYFEDRYKFARRGDIDPKSNYGIGSVSFHECENALDNSLLKNDITRFIDLKISSKTGLNLIDFLNLPDTTVRMIYDEAQGMADKENSAMAEELRKLELVKQESDRAARQSKKNTES